MVTSGMIRAMEEQLSDYQEELRKWERDKEQFQNYIVLNQEQLACDECECGCRGIKINQITTVIDELNSDYEETCYQIFNNRINDVEQEIQQTASRIRDMKEQLREQEEAERRAREEAQRKAREN